jgi:hypothetical protein
MTGEEARYDFEEDGGRSVLLHKVEESEGEDASLAIEASALSCNREVLTGKTAGPENSAAGTRLCDSVCAVLCSRMLLVGSPVCCQSNDVTEVRDSRPSLCEDGAGVGVDL